MTFVPTCLITFLTNSSLHNFTAAKAKGTHLRVHFKHTREIGQAIKGRSIANARSYLENVLAFKEAIPFTKYTGGIGRHAVAKQYKTPGDKVQWPQKATKTFLDLLRNIESNAEAKGLELEKVIITSVNCNQAPKMRRRTYRAHGRINGTLQRTLRHSRMFYCYSSSLFSQLLHSLPVFPCPH